MGRCWGDLSSVLTNVAANLWCYLSCLLTGIPELLAIESGTSGEILAHVADFPGLLADVAGLLSHLAGVFAYVSQWSFAPCAEVLADFASVFANVTAVLADVATILANVATVLANVTAVLAYVATVLANIATVLANVTAVLAWRGCSWWCGVSSAEPHVKPPYVAALIQNKCRKIYVRFVEMLLDDIASLSPRDKALCRRAGYQSTEKLLVDGLSTLAANLRVPESEAERLRGSVVAACAPVATCMWDAVKDRMHAMAHVPGTPNQDDCIIRHEHADPRFASAPLVYTPNTLSTGNAALDACTRGLEIGTVTEIVGESSTGKTQLVLSIAVCTALGLADERAGREPDPDCLLDNGDGHRVSILTTQGESSARRMVDRMVEIADKVIREQCAARMHVDVGSIISNMLANVTVAHAVSYDAVEHILNYTLPGHISRSGPISLFVLDNVASIMSDDVLGIATVPRQMRVHGIADALKRLAAGGTGSPPMAILVTNQVGDAFPHECALVERAYAAGELPAPSTSAPAAGPFLEPEQVLPLCALEQIAHISGLYASVPHGGEGHVVTRVADSALKTAQLGPAWANLVNARWMISRNPRRLRVVFSPQAAYGEVYFSILESGVHARAQLLA